MRQFVFIFFVRQTGHKCVGEVLDPLGPHALYHNEAPDLHRLESCVTGHVYYNRTPHPGPPTHYDATTRMYVYTVCTHMESTVCIRTVQTPSARLLPFYPESLARGCSGSTFFYAPGTAVQGRSSRAPSPACPNLDLHTVITSLSQP